MTHAAIYFQPGEPFGEIILNQPDKRNALNSEMWAALPDLIAEAEADPNVKIVLVHGGEAGAFAAGADISEFETVYGTPESSAAYSRSIAVGLRAVEHCAKPTIAVINGACVGGGTSLALACDIRIASERSKFGVTPGKLGLVYPVDDTRRLLQTVGPSKTKDILFTGRIFDVEEAKAIGLVDQIAAQEDLMEHARAYGSQIASISQWSTRATKRMIRLAAAGGHEDDAEKLFLEAFEGVDFNEGYRAFLEKRTPKFPFT
ncbi:MAG: enoyl-CoA hydratase-related protein [Pseudomonadota bacterium]